MVPADQANRDRADPLRKVPLQSPAADGAVSGGDRRDPESRRNRASVSDFFLCLDTLGYRSSEARFLRLADFDFANHCVRVRQKGGNWKILPLNGQVIEAVHSLAKQQGSGPEDYIFLSSRTTTPSEERKPIVDLRASIARICKAAGVTKR